MYQFTVAYSEKSSPQAGESVILLWCLEVEGGTEREREREREGGREGGRKTEGGREGLSLGQDNTVSITLYLALGSGMVSGLTHTCTNRKTIP